MCSGEKLNAESSNRAALKECVSKQRGCVLEEPSTPESSDSKPPALRG